MRIEMAHVENFGRLHQQDFYFEDEGLSVFQEPNGFGKSTLAVFIKAMFYGLSGNARTVDGNERKKYSPWQGGEFGGYLIFEYGGERYRITRTFGKTKKDDDQSLTFESTGKRAARLEEMTGLGPLGVALFGLDASSFEKSVFVPQGRVTDDLGDSQIGTKLASLLESTDEGVDYDSALARVKEIRKTVKPYKGKGGTLNEYSSAITELEDDILRKKQDEVLLDGIRTEIEVLESQLGTLDSKISEIREAITLTSSAESNRMLLERKSEFEQRIKQLEVDKQKALGCFPDYVPSLDELSDCVDLLDSASILAGQISNAPSVEASDRVVKEFAAKFAKGLPSEQEIEDKLEECEELERSRQALAEVIFTGQEQERLFQLEHLFPQRTPSSEDMAAIRSVVRNRTSLIGAVAASSRSSEDEVQLSILQGFFKRGVPSEDVLNVMESKLDDSDLLRQQSHNKLLEATGQNPFDESQNSSNGESQKWGLLALASALVLIVAAVASYVIVSSPVIAVACLCIAVVCAIAFFVLRKRQSRSQPSSSIDERLKAQSQELAVRANQLQDEVRTFVSGYFSDGRPLRPALADLRARAQKLVILEGQLDGREARSTELSEEIAQCDTEIQSFLGAFFQGSDDYDNCLMRMQAAIDEIGTLRERREAYASRHSQLAPLIQQLSNDIEAFLCKYGMEMTGAVDLRASVYALATDASRYAQAAEIVAGSKRETAAKEKQLHEIQKRVSEFSANLGLSNALDRESLSKLIETRKGLDAYDNSLIENRRSYQSFMEQNPDLSKLTVGEHVSLSTDSASLGEIDALTDKESELLHNRDVIQGTLNAKRADELALMQSVSNIAVLRDELDDARISLASERRKLNNLDRVIDYMDRAKESLSIRFLAPVTDAFNIRAESLLPEEYTCRIDESLNVSVDDRGHFRESAYFSAGINDILAVCMRIALADTLFDGEKVFMVLDDPFINLDDERLEKALALLEEIARDRQIIYLTCHKSRDPFS